MYKLNKEDFIHSFIGDTSIWMNMSDSTVIELNDTASFIVKLLSNCNHTEKYLIQIVCEEYNISPEQCSDDIKEALSQLLNTRLISQE